MVLDIEISDVLSITQTIGIIGTLLLAVYFSRRQIKDLSVDTETKVLSDLDEKMHRLEKGYHRFRVVDKDYFLCNTHYAKYNDPTYNVRTH